MGQGVNQIAYTIMRAAQLAAVLEVAGWPKPGNVHRTADFEDTRFEQFMAGAIALGPSVRDVALRGIRAAQGRLPLHEIRIGKYVKKAVSVVRNSHLGGNTHLGISLLFIPLAAAAGMTHRKRGNVESLPLREYVMKIMKATTSQDAIDAYDAINLATSAALGQLNGEPAPDLSDQNASTKLTAEKITLYEAMRISSKWDNIAKEWATGMEICFKTGYPTLMNVYNETHDINTAIVHMFLTILSRHPDTFIARKVGTMKTPHISKAVETGLKKTAWITETARNILMIGGLTTELGRNKIFDFDRKLQQARGMYNPGTTADLTAGSLMIAMLCGFRF
jgi:triphosphoribosyl-dephospho-CoA synthase